MIRKGMNKSELKEFQTLLRERSTLLQGDLDGLEGETRGSGSDRAGDQSTVPGHMAELASDASEKTLSFGRMESQTEELKEIKDALERIKDGSFGSCENCQGRIPKERLKAISYARLCVKCQGKEEGR
ncbi:MAG TPA: TraR/DksA family transcriptional regulator [Planctomycetota bacterium]|nr:TraR/DksA family transcriptional regulator [Planctomycetota bacterium]